MFPYEVLVGLRRTMCTCARGFVVKNNSYKKLSIEETNLYNFSTNTLHNKSSPRVFYENVNTKMLKRFHTHLSANNSASSKDAKPIDDAPVPTEDSFENLYNLSRSQHRSRNKENLEKNLTSSESTNYIPESVKKWLHSDVEKVPSKDIEQKFPEPKVFLNNLFALVANETKNPHSLHGHAKQVQTFKNKQSWSFTYNIVWPEKMAFTSVGHSKASTSHSAALKCLYWLHLNGRIKNRTPVIYQKNETKTILNAPEELNIDKNVLERINIFLDNNEKDIQQALSNKMYEKEEENLEENEIFEDEAKPKPHPISHLKFDPTLRVKALEESLRKRKETQKTDLPIFQFRQSILKNLEENQALVIKGDTGCGKTTQVPQFIIDDMVEKGQALDCSMIVTQPRRISAISLAQRIASERKEAVGDVVGYQVRLQHVLPRQQGSILFCTTGILLKKLQSNLHLEGCSHVIIDEAHERSVDTDMLLVLLRRAIKKNPSLKLIVMSATINADLFQNYLNCNAVEVPGRLYPVQMHFMEDITQIGIQKPQRVYNSDGEGDGPIVDCDQITDLIRWISANKPPGAILCFLPGWGHIQKVQTNLENLSDSRKQLIIPLHSRIPYMVQSKIFEPSPEGVRKIILSTDIAETGITVPDVCYVIDSACHKQVRWHESRGLSSISTHWVAQANINQRKGRAGRVQKGESYHLISKKQFEELEPYPRPEVLRVSLEKVVLDCKTYSNEKVEEFLGSMPQPPRLSAVRKAVDDLQTLGALDENEDLTSLGKRIALFAIHPKLSKSMVYSTIFQCLNPVATVASAFSMESEIFYGSLENKSRIRNLKTRFHPTSDHLAIAWLYEQYSNVFKKGPRFTYAFCKQNHLHGERMSILHRSRDINLEHLRESGLISDVLESSSLHSNFNSYATLDELTRGVLLAGMDQILKHRNFDFRKGRFTQNSTSMVTEDDAKSTLSTESVNFKRKSWPSPFLIYYQKTHHHERRTTLIRESSMLSPVTVLLFSQGRVTGIMQKDENQNEAKVLLKVDGKNNVNFICDEVTAETLLRFRDVMWSIVRYYVQNNVSNNLFDRGLSEDARTIDTHRKGMLQVLANLLDSASVKIDSPEEPNDSHTKFPSIRNSGDEN